MRSFSTLCIIVAEMESTKNTRYSRKLQMTPKGKTASPMPIDTSGLGKHLARQQGLADGHVAAAVADTHQSR